MKKPCNQCDKCILWIDTGCSDDVKKEEIEGGECPAFAPTSDW